MNYTLPAHLIEILSNKGFSFLKNISYFGATSFKGQGWINAMDLGLQNQDIVKWNTYILKISIINVRICYKSDELVWLHSDIGSYNPKYGYIFLSRITGFMRLCGDVNLFGSIIVL